MTSMSLSLPTAQNETLAALRDTLYAAADLVVRLATLGSSSLVEPSAEASERPPPLHAEPPNDYVTTDEYAERRGVGRTTVFGWIRSGLPSVKQGGSRRIRWREADAFLDSGMLSNAKSRRTKKR